MKQMFLIKARINFIRTSSDAVKLTINVIISINNCPNEWRTPWSRTQWYQSGEHRQTRWIYNCQRKIYRYNSRGSLQKFKICASASALKEKSRAICTQSGERSGIFEWELIGAEFGPVNVLNVRAPLRQRLFSRCRQSGTEWQHCLNSIPFAPLHQSWSRRGNLSLLIWGIFSTVGSVRYFRCFVDFFKRQPTEIYKLKKRAFACLLDALHHPLKTILWRRFLFSTSCVLTKTTTTNELTNRGTECTNHLKLRKSCFQNK